MKLFGVEHRPWSQELRWLAFLAGAALVAVMVIDEYLATPGAAQLATSYELADNPEKAELLHKQWERESSLWLQVSLWFDFIFIAFYAVFLVKLANHFLYDRPGVREQKAGRLAKILLVIGAAGDAAENACTLMAIYQPDNSVWPPATAIATAIKFTGLIVGGAALLVVRAARRHPLKPGSWDH